MKHNNRLKNFDTESAIAKAVHTGSEIALTRAIYHIFEDYIKYDSSINQWRIYENGIWEIDLKKTFRPKLEDAADTLIRKILKNVKDKENEAISSGDYEKGKTEVLVQKYKAVKRLSGKTKTIQGINQIEKQLSNYTMCNPSDFDNQKDLVALENGVYSFDTGNLLDHDPNFLFTKRLNISYSKDAKIEKWSDFLNLIFRGNTEVITYVQKIFGYCLTGHNSLQSLFFLYGDGANGKSMLVNVLKALLGDQEAGYFFQFKADQLLGKQKYQDNTKQYTLASMAGKRLVVGSEVPSDMIFDTSMVKDLTGGDSVAARHPAGQPFNYMPQYKTFLYGNHKPKLKETDTGIRRRIKLVKFDYNFETEGKHLKRDAEIVFKEFIAELPGIFLWAAEGYNLYKKEGLKEPEYILEATKEYINNQDQVQNFFEDELEINSALEILAKEVWKKYNDWINENGYYRTYGKKELFQEIEKLGIHSENKRNGKTFMGIGFKVEGFDEIGF